MMPCSTRIIRFLMAGFNPRPLRMSARQVGFPLLLSRVRNVKHARQQLTQPLACEEPILNCVESHVIKHLAAYVRACTGAATVHAVVAGIIGIAPTLARVDRHATLAAGHAAASYARQERSAGRDMPRGSERIARGTDRRHAVELLTIDDSRARHRDRVLRVWNHAVIVRGTIVIDASINFPV